ncbi:MAG: DUF4037 domain-containing protein, partial [Proteobacteria bacterium]|nr:DUF4037 domain-containing protein [Pseudomonadota bacterium]
IASALNSCVYCLLGSLPSLISILRTSEVINFLLYVKSRQGHDAVEAIIEDVVDRHDTTHNGLVFEKQTTAFILQRSHILHGFDLIGQWRSRLSPYPEALAVSMVRKHLTFMPFDGQRVLAERREIPMLYGNRCAIVRRLLNILFGLNRIYHPGFKWTQQYIQEMHIKPPDLFARLERAFRSDGSSMDDLEQVVEEALSLVEIHLPQIELSWQREIFRRPCPRWALRGPA